MRDVGRGEPGQELLAGRERRALVQLVELDAGDQLAVAGPELVALGRQRPVQDDEPTTRVEGRPRGAQDRRRVGQLVERVLEVGEVVLAGAARFGDAGVADGRSGRPGRPPRPWPRARATESASNSTPTSSSAGKRRAMAMSQRPPPQWTSTTRPPRDRSATSCGSAARASWKKTAMSWAVSRSIAIAVAIGPVADRLAGPEEVEHRRPSRARRPRRGRTDRRGTRSGSRRAGSTATSSSMVRRSSSRVTRSCASAAQAQASTACGWQPARPARSIGRQAVATRPPDVSEEPEFDPEVDEPRAVEPAEAGDQVVESIVEGHRRPIVAWRQAPTGTV